MLGGSLSFCDEVLLFLLLLLLLFSLLLLLKAQRLQALQDLRLQGHGFEQRKA